MAEVIPQFPGDNLGWGVREVRPADGKFHIVWPDGRLIAVCEDEVFAHQASMSLRLAMELNTFAVGEPEDESLSAVLKEFFKYSPAMQVPDAAPRPARAGHHPGQPEDGLRTEKRDSAGVPAAESSDPNARSA